MANDLPDYFQAISRYVRKIGSGTITSNSLPQLQALLATDQSLIVLVGASTTDVTINAVGSATGVELGSQVVKSGDTNRAVIFPAYGVFDADIKVTFATGDIGTGWWTAASDDQAITAQRTVDVGVVSSIQLGTLDVHEDTAADTLVTLELIATANGVILAAPPAGHYYRIKYLATFVGFLSAPAAGDYVFIRGITSQARLLQRVAQTGSLDLDAQVPLDINIGEGLEMYAQVPAADAIFGVVVYSTHTNGT